MRLLILGATGRTGAQLLDRGLGEGHQVTAFARRPSALARYGSRIRVVQGDVAVASSVDRAIPGHDAVLSALGSPTLRRNTVLSDGMRHVLAAMKDHGVRRLLAMSALGVGETKGQLGPVYNLLLTPLMLRNTFLEKERMEAYIKAAELEWTIVRPAVLTSGPARGRYHTALADVQPPRFPHISRADVAAFMLAEVQQRRFLRQAVGLWDEPQR